MGHAERKGALRAFILAAPPSVVRKAATGIVSLFMALLSIPLALGIGTAVDTTILVTGLAIPVDCEVKGGAPRPEAPER